MKAPEFPRELRWYNSTPLVMKQLRGKVVLIDFWTYSCMNCIRAIPHVVSWHAQYKDSGLVILGVHTPEFEFEKEPSNVQAAVKALGITYPVVMDNEYQIWSTYGNNVWPRKFLVNYDGQIVYDHAGEGGYEETEAAIQSALLEINPAVTLPPIASDDGSGGLCYPMTAETYLGSLRGRQGDIWKSSGAWKARPEYLEHEENTSDFRDVITLHFTANEVNLVMGKPDGLPFLVRLDLDSKHLRDFEAGRYAMYNLLSLPEVVRGTLKISVKDKGVRAYAFTFGGCVTNKNEKNKSKQKERQE